MMIPMMLARSNVAAEIAGGALGNASTAVNSAGASVVCGADASAASGALIDTHRGGRLIHPRDRPH